MPKTAPFQNLGDLLDRLGNVSPSRICLDPPPGQATKRDLIRRHSRNGKLYELIDGTLVEKTMGAPEAYLALELAWHFGSFLRERDLGYLYGADALVELMPKLVRGPDLCFTSWDKRPERTVPGKQIADLVPDLVVEVLSPKNTRREIARKLKEYFFAGVRLAWVIDPARRTAQIYTSPDAVATIAEAGALDGGDVLPGFTLSLATLFARLEKPAKKRPRKK